MDGLTNGMNTGPDLRGWLPLFINRRTAAPVVEWCRPGTRRFMEPFFEDTLKAVMREPFNLLFRHQTPLDALLAWQRESPGLEPGGFIFHMSRCGSTLVSQMLAALPEHIVLSEPPPLDALLRTDRRGAADDQRIAWLRAWMSAISQPRNGEQRLYVKLDAWHIFDLPILLRAFPGTPWIFLYRNPVEVMASAMKVPGLHLIEGLIDTNMPAIAPPRGQRSSQVEYAAGVLANIMRAALEHLALPGGRAFDYSRLPEAVIADIAPHFRLDLTGPQIEAMNARIPFNVKTPQLYFESDTARKQQEASAEIRALCAEHLDDLYGQLRAL